MTLDLVMPNLDGLGVLRALASLEVQSPPRAVIVSMAESDGDLAVAALEAGAIDIVHKPTALATDRLFELADELVAKVAAAADVTPRPAPPARTSAARPPLVLPRPPRRRIVVLGASTGGPQALSALLPELPADFPVPIAIALHMPVGYTEALARRLDQLCAIEVVEAHEGIQLLPGRAVVARAGMHLKILPGAPARGHLDIRPLDKPHRPSVDVLLESAATVFGAGALAVVLTGMGDDGSIGAARIRATGGTMITEEESSCVVFGMPRAVQEAGLSDVQATLGAMGAAIFKQL
jgi:two-component system chemotaxis response regulator CheB